MGTFLPFYVFLSRTNAGIQTKSKPLAVPRLRNYGYSRVKAWIRWEGIRK
jgi:hypothetical protein